MPHANHNAIRILAGERGAALFAVLIFAVVAGISGLAFYAMTSYETKGARSRQFSSEAFYLADGAVERARGEFLEDIHWRGPIPATSLGKGTYALTARDTLINGEDLVQLEAEGRVGETARGVEVTGRVESVIEALGIFTGGNFTAAGNLDVSGHIHINGTADFGADDIHLKGGTYDEGHFIDPPAVYTHPDSFATATFYRVIGDSLGAGNNRAVGRIFKWNRSAGQWVRVATDSLVGNNFKYFSPSLGYPGGHFEFSFQKTGGASIASYFDYTTGVFRKDPADQSVVVDFGWPRPGTQSVTNLSFQNPNADVLIETTIINTRFGGITDDDRVAPCGVFWTGGSLAFGSRVTLAPRNCVAVITHTLGPDNAQGMLGTPDDPALSYVTGNVVGLKGDLQINGVLISLCHINSQGGPNVVHDPSVLDCIPSGVLGEGGAGFFKQRSWRERTL